MITSRLRSPGRIAALCENQQQPAHHDHPPPRRKRSTSSIRARTERLNRLSTCRAHMP